MKRFISTSLFLFLAIGMARAQINTNQINWGARTGCTTTGFPWVPADAQCESIGGGNNSPMYYLLPNDASGTGTGLLACWTSSALHQTTVTTCGTSNNNGSDNNPPIVGVCVSGCGTSGWATIQFAGAVSWLCDGTVTTTEYWVQPSASVAGECTQPTGSFAPSPNENPEGNTTLGRPLVGNAGAGTAAIIQLLPYAGYTLGNNTSQFVMAVGMGSPFLTMSHVSQSLSTDPYIPYAVTANGFFIYNGGSNKNIIFGQSTQGTSGKDVILDSLTNGPGLPPNAQLRVKMSQYQVPQVVSSATGTVTLGGHSSNFDVGNSTGVYILNLTGNATTYTPADDNAGHIITFVITPNAFTWTWPSGTPAFIGAPIVTNTSTPVSTSFIFDGTNYDCIAGCHESITALTGDVTASGPGSAAATLATVNSNVGTFKDVTITVDAKGRITAASVTTPVPIFGTGLVEQGANPSGTWNVLGNAYSGCASATASQAAASSTAPAMGISTSAAVTADCAGWFSNSQVYYSGRQPKISFGVGYSSSADYTTNARIWLGFYGNSCSVATMTGSDTPACSYAMIRSSTSASDTAYKCVTDNGSGSPTVTSITVAPTTAYTLMSIAINSGSVTCTVGSTSVSNSATLPASTLTLGNGFFNSDLSTNTVHIRATNVYGYDQTGTF